MPFNPNHKLKREDAKEVLKGGPPMGRAGNTKKYQMEQAGNITGMIRLKKRCQSGTITSASDELVVEEGDFCSPIDRHIEAMYMAGNDEALDYYD